jgi:heme exporter protein B
VLVSPLDPGIFYLAKVAATWLYVMAMECLAGAAYVILFDFNRWERLPLLLAAMGAFTLAYVGAGAVIAAMTSSLRGGEVVLRILLFPIMIPVVMIVIQGGEAIFPAEPPPGAPGLGITLGRILPLALIYISLGFILFPKVVEE